MSIRGTLATNNGAGNSVHIYGKNVHLEPHNLPQLEGTDVPIQLPVAVIRHDLRIEPDAGGSLSGLLAIWDVFEIISDNQYDIKMTIQGGIVAENFLIRGRSDWIQSAAWWTAQYDVFLDQEDEEGGVRHLPVWLHNQRGLAPNPRLTVKPEL